MSTRRVIPLLTLLFLLIPFCDFAQGTLTGIVTGDGTPLENTTVLVSPGGGTTTDAAGKYTISLSAGSHIVTFSNIGFAAQTLRIVITDGQTKELNVVLTGASQSFTEISTLPIML